MGVGFGLVGVVLGTSVRPLGHTTTLAEGVTEVILRARCPSDNYRLQVLGIAVLSSSFVPSSESHE